MIFTVVAEYINFLYCLFVHHIQFVQGKDATLNSTLGRLPIETSFGSCLSADLALGLNALIFIYLFDLFILRFVFPRRVTILNKNSRK